MKVIIEFKIPEEADLLRDYEERIKYKWFLDEWIHTIKYEIEQGGIKKASELLDRLKSDLYEIR
jgi:hypothetical protein